MTNTSSRASDLITIPTPESFNFKRTVLSHGWCELPPFRFDRESWTLTRVVDIPGRRPVAVAISPGDQTLIVKSSRVLGARSRQRVIRDVRHMLRLDDDMDAFYESVAADSEFSWIAREGMGRLLRAPTIFEDLIKMVCTTNCSWALTEKMVNGLVNFLGEETAEGLRAFPAPEAMAAASLKFYRDKVRAGYRGPYLKELARRVASGELNLNNWLEWPLSALELKKEMKRIKGVGDYTAENMLKLVGRFEGLALDSWIRGKFARVRNNGRKASDKKIERFYARFNSWSGLVLWCDMTRDWLGEDGRVTV